MNLLRFFSPGAKTSLGPIPKFSSAWGPGVHAIVKTPDGSPTALFSAIAGATAARGCVTTLGEDVPWASFAHVPDTIDWPRDLTVSDALTIAAASRDATASVDLLNDFSLGHLGKVRVRDLERATLRAIAVLEALRGARTRILLLDEGPIDGRVAPDLSALLHTHAEQGAAVLVAARERGVVVSPTTERPLDADGTVGLRIDAGNVDALIVALARFPELRVAKSGKRTLWIASASTDVALHAIHEATRETGIAIDLLEIAS